MVFYVDFSIGVVQGSNLLGVLLCFFSLIFSNPTSESERNKESNDSYKSHPQQRLKIGLWAQNSAHIKWNGYVGCVIRQTQHPLVKSILSSLESLVIFSFCNFFKEKLKSFESDSFFGTSRFVRFTG